MYYKTYKIDDATLQIVRQFTPTPNIGQNFKTGSAISTNMVLSRIDMPEFRQMTEEYNTWCFNNNNNNNLYSHK